MKYYAVFTKTNEAVEVVFPDLEGCLTFGDDFEAAYDMAVDALSGWLAHSEKRFVNPPSTYEDLREKFDGENQVIFPIVADEAIIRLYEPKKRVNIVLPTSILSKIDEFRAQKGNRDRSRFISDVMNEYIENASL